MPRSDSLVPAVAYGFVGPDAIEIFLKIQGYQVSLFDGDLNSLSLREDKPSRNVVILPNFSKLAQLAPVVDKLGYIIVLTNGHHEPIVEHDIPLLDSYVDQDNVLQQLEDQSPHYYIKKMEEVAKPIDLGGEVAEQSGRKKKEKPEKSKEVPTTLDQWFDTIYGGCTIFEGSEDEIDAQFAEEIECPACQFLVGDLGQDDFKRALQSLVKRGADKITLRDFYRWLTKDKYADRMAKAMRMYLQPAHEDVFLPASAVAKKYRVSAVDVELLENIYQEAQGENNG